MPETNSIENSRGVDLFDIATWKNTRRSGPGTCLSAGARAQVPPEYGGSNCTPVTICVYGSQSIKSAFTANLWQSS